MACYLRPRWPGNAVSVWPMLSCRFDYACVARRRAPKGSPLMIRACRFCLVRRKINRRLRTNAPACTPPASSLGIARRRGPPSCSMPAADGCRREPRRLAPAAARGAGTPAAGRRCLGRQLVSPPAGASGPLPRACAARGQRPGIAVSARLGVWAGGSREGLPSRRPDPPDATGGGPGLSSAAFAAGDGPTARLDCHAVRHEARGTEQQLGTGATLLRKRTSKYRFGGISPA